MATIGILGGMGPQASAHLVNLIVQNAHKHMTIKDDSDFPEIVLLSVPVPNFVNNKANMAKALALLKQRVKLLETAGCTVAGIACNTAHLMLDELKAETSVPFVSIPKLVNEKLVTLGAKRVGLLATPSTLRSRLYDDAMDASVELVRPSQGVVEELERLIRRRLSASKSSATDRRRLRAIVDNFMRERQLDVVVLGCTELPLVFGESEDGRVVSSLGILGEGLLEF